MVGYRELTVLCTIQFTRFLRAYADWGGKQKSGKEKIGYKRRDIVLGEQAVLFTE